MEQRVVFIMTHDSIGLGEDGPTHQPVEHLAALRAIPHLRVFRPADTVETAECWELALRHEKRPSVIALSRQALPTVRRGDVGENQSARGGYVLAEAEGKRQATIIATGSEVSLAMEAQALLAKDGVAAAVVSLPCWELFDEQPADYRAGVLGPERARVAVEAASGFGWERHIGPRGIFVGMGGFGASAPAEDLYKHFGITAEAVAAAVKSLI
jgi:transketolase